MKYNNYYLEFSTGRNSPEQSMHTVAAFTSIRAIDVVQLLHYLSRVWLVASNNNNHISCMLPAYKL